MDHKKGRFVCGSLAFYGVTINVSNSHTRMQTAKDLLKHEWPIKIRLIGLRVTKLKDLNAVPTGGIKRVCGFKLSLFALPLINS
jgi:hypothetical protein